MTSPHWATCPNCGEKPDTSGRYTSPENNRRDTLQWVKEHESGKCVQQKPTDVLIAQIDERACSPQ